MAAPELTFRLIDGRQAAAQTAELQELHAAVYAGTARRRADGTDDDPGVFAGRFRVQSRQPGFALAEARHGGYGTAAIWSATPPGCRCGRRHPGGAS